MDRHSENHYKSVLTTMAATTSDSDSINVKNAKRFSDCYTHIAKTIKANKDNPEIQDSTIRVYSFGSKAAHCILVDKNKNVVADIVKDKINLYDPKTGKINYETDAFPKNLIMGDQLNLGENSLELSVKDYLKLVDNVELLVEVLKEQDPKFNFMHLKNKGNTIEESIESVKLNNDMRTLGLIKEAPALKENNEPIYSFEGEDEPEIDLNELMNSSVSLEDMIAKQESAEIEKLMKEVEDFTPTEKSNKTDKVKRKFK